MSNKPTPGLISPGIRVSTLRNGDWSLNDAKAERFAMLIFYRGKHCRICEEYLKEFDRLVSEFEELGVEIMAISGDDEDTAEAAVSDWELGRLRLGYGLTEVQMRDWGLYVSEGISDDEPEVFCEPGLFLIETKSLKNYYTALNSMPFGRPQPSEMLKSVKWVTEEDYPFRGTKKPEIPASL